jgi:hypothetical protein
MVPRHTLLPSKDCAGGVSIPVSRSYPLVSFFNNSIQTKNLTKQSMGGCFRAPRGYSSDIEEPDDPIPETPKVAPKPKVAATPKTPKQEPPNIQVFKAHFVVLFNDAHALS